MRPPKRQRRRWFLKEWREHRQLSQEKLAEALDMTQGMISQLETGRINYTSNHLDLLAKALMCEPADLLTRDPNDPEAPWTLWESLPTQQRRQAIEILKALKRTAEG
jgi:transcriptional regulator with XRE-family HTH domain